MLSKSSKWELGFVHYIAKFTISRLVISRFECTVSHVTFFYCFSLLNLISILQFHVFFFQKLTDEDCLLRPQSQFGILYEENGYILFQAQVMELPTVAFLIDVFCRSATFQSENHEPAEANINHNIKIL